MSAAVDIRAAAPEPASRDAWREQLAALASADSERSWALADCLAAGAAAFGDSAFTEASEISGRSVKKLKLYATLAKIFPSDRRRSTPAFSHHLEVYGLPEADRERLLDAAAAGSWTRTQVRNAVREAGGGAETERLRLRVAELERLLALERTTDEESRRARTIVERAVRHDCKTMAGACREMTASIKAYLGSPAYGMLHGNARRSVVRALRDQVREVTQETAGLIDRELDPLLKDGE